MPADDIDRALVRDRLASAVREAGALALHMFRGRPASWIKGASSPVSEADLAVDALLRERLLAIRDAGVAGLPAGSRRKAKTIPRDCNAPRCGWSIPSTARALISRGLRSG